MYIIETAIGFEHRVFTLCEKGSIKMDLYIVTEGNSGYCVGAFTTLKRAQAAKQVRENDGYPCREIQMVHCNDIEELGNES